MLIPLLNLQKLAAPYNVEWFEEPVHAFDMEALRSLRDQMDNAGISMEIAMGESVRSYHAHVDYAEHGVRPSPACPFILPC